MEKLKGSLHENHGVWYVYFRVRDANGKQKQKCISTKIRAEKGSKRRAEAKMAEILAEWEGLEDSSQTLTGYVEKYLALRKSKIAPTTWDDYQRIYRAHISPYFSDNCKKLLNKLKPEDIDKFYNHLLEQNLKATTIKKDHALLRLVFQHAHDNHYIKDNIMEKVKAPSAKGEKPKHDFLTISELKYLLKCVAGDKMELPIFFAAVFGLRKSEILGLRWSAVDFQNYEINVVKKVVKTTDENGKLIDKEFDEMKTASSSATYKINDTIAEFLKQHKEKQKAHDNDPICIDENGQRLKSDYISHRFGELLTKYSVKQVRFHDLRHSCISALVSMGFSMKAIQEYARHSSYKVTADTYSHITSDAKLEQLNELTATLFDFTSESTDGKNID